jgi:quercetin dioxygenase-like cupin family protein
MFVSRSRLDLPSEQRSETFTGTVFADAVVPASSGVVVNNVFFTPGARTYWHTHEIGQLLQVLAGKGAVVTREGHVEFISAGDSVWIPAGEEHWHGATPDTYLLHCAVSVGKTQWLEEVADDDYAISR